MEDKEIKKPKSGGVFGMIIAQAVTAAVIISAVLTVKYFFKETYSELKSLYTENICAETDIGEVLEADGGEDAV